MVRDFASGCSIGAIMGFTLGVFGTTILAVSVGPRVDKAKVFPRENEPAIMRLYSSQADRLFVEELKGEYKPLNNYLSAIEDIADRELEEARIKKLVEWYKE